MIAFVFWRMPFDDFCSNFTNLVICRTPNKSYLSLHRTWHETVMISAWKVGQGRANRAGGCINNRETFLLNPQVCQQQFNIVIILPNCTRTCNPFGPNFTELLSTQICFKHEISSFIKQDYQPNVHVIFRISKQQQSCVYQGRNFMLSKCLCLAALWNWALVVTAFS